MTIVTDQMHGPDRDGTKLGKASVPFGSEIFNISGIKNVVVVVVVTFF